MSDRVHALMDAMQATEPDPLLDRPAPESEREQLPSRHHPMLPTCELRNLAVPNTRDAFSPYVVGNASLVRGRVRCTSGHAATMAIPGARVARKARILSRESATKKGPSPPLPPLALIP